MAIEFNIYGKHIEPKETGIQTVDVLEPKDISNLVTQTALNNVSNNLNTNFFRISGGNITGSINVFGNLSASGDFFYANKRRSIFLSDTLLLNQIYNVDTTVGSLTATLPNNPLLGDEIEFLDVMGNWDINPFYIKSDLDKIEKTNNQLLKCDVKYGHFKLNFVDPQNYGWKITAFPNILIKNIYDNLLINLIDYWSFEQTSKSIYANETILNSIAVPSFTLFNNLDGSYYVQTTNTRLFTQQNLWNVKTNPTSYSISVWIKKTTNGLNGQEGIYMGSCFGPMGFFISDLSGDFTDDNFPPNQRLAFSLSKSSNYDYEHLIYDWHPNLNEWFHVVGVYNYENLTAKFFVNGVLRDVKTNVLNNNCVHENWNGFALNGSVTENGTEYGNINGYDYDNLAMWNRALQDNEAISLYNNFFDINTFITNQT